MFSLYVTVNQNIHKLQAMWARPPETFEKLPKAIGFALERGVAGTPEVISLLQACVRHRLSHIILYDLEGELVQDFKPISLAFSKAHKLPVRIQVGDRGLVAHNGRINESPPSSTAADNLGDGPELVFFSAKTTRERMNRSLRRFCTQKKSGLDGKEMGFHLAGDAAAEELASPELVVVIGRHFSLKGMPAWVCGTAEIGQMQDLRNVDVGLREALSQYDRSTQRLGA